MSIKQMDMLKKAMEIFDASSYRWKKKKVWKTMEQNLRSY